MPPRPGQPAQLSWRGRLACLLAVLLTVAALAVAALAVTPTADAGEARVSSAQCPVVVVVAAGAAEPGGRGTPTRYSPEAPWVSNGYEDHTIGAFLRHAEDRYRHTHGGESLMKDVQVLGLDPRYHQEPPATRESGRGDALSEGLRQMTLLAGRIAHPVAQAVSTATDALRGGAPSAPTGAGLAIRDYETATGCTPDYILVGHSEGAAALEEQEKALYERGQLAGVLRLGSPAAVDPATGLMGVSEAVNGLLRHLGPGGNEPATTDNRINYCLPADAACIGADEDGAGDTGATAARVDDDYLSWDTPWDQKVMDAFGSWVEQAR